MKMYGYVARDKSLLFVRSNKEYVRGSFISYIKRKLGFNTTEAGKYVDSYYNEIEIEYNEVT